MHSSECLLDTVGRAACETQYTPHGASHHGTSGLADELTARSSETAKPDGRREHPLLCQVLSACEIKFASTR